MLILDYSSRQDPAYLVSQGVVGVMRYLSYSPGKNIDRAEADALLAAGISIGLVWETFADRALSGYAGGAEDAQAAYAQAQAVGQPTDRPIYFAVDFDAQPNDYPVIADYFRGVNSVIGLERTRAYGKNQLLDYLFDAGVISGGWGTYAWSGGYISPHANLYQYSNGEWGGSVDFNEAKAEDYGQWPYQQEDDMPRWETTRMESSKPDGKKWSGHCDTALTNNNTQVMIVAHAAADPGEPFPFDHIHAIIMARLPGPDFKIVGEIDVPVGTDASWPLKDYTGQISIDVDQPNACACYLRELL